MSERILKDIFAMCAAFFFILLLWIGAGLFFMDAVATSSAVNQQSFQAYFYWLSIGLITGFVAIWSLWRWARRRQDPTKPLLLPVLKIILTIFIVPLATYFAIATVFGLAHGWLLAQSYWPVTGLLFAAVVTWRIWSHEKPKPALSPSPLD